MKKQIGNFLFQKTPFKGIHEIEAKKHGDNRGCFMETYKKKDFDETGLVYSFFRDNQSKSKKGVLNGFHFQKTFPQAKLVRRIESEVFDAHVGSRKNSPIYDKWHGVVLSAEKGNQFLVPRRFTNGFLVLSDTATFCYKSDELYHPEDKGGIMWNDPDANIDCPDVGEVLLSEKDKNSLNLKDLEGTNLFCCVR